MIVVHISCNFIFTSIFWTILYLTFFNLDSVGKNSSILLLVYILWWLFYSNIFIKHLFSRKVLIFSLTSFIDNPALSESVNKIHLDFLIVHHRYLINLMPFQFLLFCAYLFFLFSPSFCLHSLMYILYPWLTIFTYNCHVT